VKTQQQKTIPYDDTSIATTDKPTKTDKQLTQIKMKSHSILSTKKIQKTFYDIHKKIFQNNTEKNSISGFYCH